MFLSSQYVLGNELVEYMGINIANVSMLSKKFENDNDDITVIKMKHCNFIKTDSAKLPHNFQKSIQEGLAEKAFTDFSDKLPCSWFREEFELTERQIMQSRMVTEKLKICGKEFYQFDHQFIKTVKGKVCYILDPQEAHECYRDKKIEGFIKLSNQKYMSWYNPRNIEQKQIKPETLEGD